MAARTGAVSRECVCVCVCVAARTGVVGARVEVRVGFRLWVWRSGLGLKHLRVGC